jgi:hypothetical protein
MIVIYRQSRTVMSGEEDLETARSIPVADIYLYMLRSRAEMRVEACGNGGGGSAFTQNLELKSKQSARG